MRKYILIGILAAVCLFSAVVSMIHHNNRATNGIIVYPNYGEAVAFCEETYSAVIHLDEAKVWNDGTATYVVNKGHENDPEVPRLVKLAHAECPAQTKEK